MRYPVQTMPDGRIRWSDGSITGAMSTNSGYVSTTPQPNTTMNSGYQVPNAPTALAPPPPPAAPTAPNNGGTDYGRSLAEAAFAAARGTAGRMRESGQRTFDGLIKSVNDFRDRAIVLKNNAGQEITDTASDLLGNNARNFEDSQAKVYSSGRALGLGAGSRLARQTGLRGGFNALQGNTLAKKGEQNAANNVWYKGKLDEADVNEGTANRYKMDVNDAANDVENSGVSNFGSALDSLLARSQALSSLTPLNAGGLSAMTPDFSGITDILNQITSGFGGAQNGEQETGNPATNVSLADYFKRKGLYQS